MQNKITEFKGVNEFLSNFFPVEIEHEGRTYQSVEHAYVASKCNSEQWKDFCSNIEVTAGQVKRAGSDKKLGKELREDWQDVKLNVMYQLLCKKFAQEPFKTKLQETGDAILEEGNQWCDTFWGIDVFTGEGENHLGKMLMQIRFVRDYVDSHWAFETSLVLGHPDTGDTLIPEELREANKDRYIATQPYNTDYSSSDVVQLAVVNQVTTDREQTALDFGKLVTTRIDERN